MNDEEISKQVELVIAQLDREYGKGTVIRLNDEPQQWEAISTGALSLDIALGIGGLPRGRIVEIYGAESSGKSTLSLSVVANAQRAGGRCLYVDAEHAVDPVYAQALGVDLPNLLFAQPSTGEEALDIVEKMVTTGEIDVIVVDSVAALTPKAELDGHISDNHIGLLPRMMAKAMRKLVGPAAETNTLIIFVNQIREKVGVMYGSPIVQPGGRALKFAASVRIELLKRETLTDKDGVVSGTTVKAKVMKNKLAPPLSVAEFDIIYAKGVNNTGCVLDLAFEKGLVKKKSAWYTYEGVNLGQGRQNASHYLEQEAPELLEKLSKELLG